MAEARVERCQAVTRAGDLVSYRRLMIADDGMLNSLRAHKRELTEGIAVAKHNGDILRVKLKSAETSRSADDAQIGRLIH